MFENGILNLGAIQESTDTHQMPKPVPGGLKETPGKEGIELSDDQKSKEEIRKFMASFKEAADIANKLLEGYEAEDFTESYKDYLVQFAESKIEGSPCSYDEFVASGSVADDAEGITESTKLAKQVYTEACKKKKECKGKDCDDKKGDKKMKDDMKDLYQEYVTKFFEAEDEVDGSPMSYDEFAESVENYISEANSAGYGAYKNEIKKINKGRSVPVNAGSRKDYAAPDQATLRAAIGNAYDKINEIYKDKGLKMAISKKAYIAQQLALLQAGKTSDSTAVAIKESADGMMSVEEHLEAFLQSL